MINLSIYATENPNNSNSQTIVEYNVEKKIRSTVSFTTENTYANGIALSPDGTTLYVIPYLSANGSISVIDTVMSTVSDPIQLEPNNQDGTIYFNSIAISADGTKLFVSYTKNTSSWQCVLAIIDLANSNSIHKHGYDQGQIRNLVYNENWPDQVFFTVFEQLVYYSVSGKTFSHAASLPGSTPTHREPLVFQNQPNDLIISPDGKTAYVNSSYFGPNYASVKMAFYIIDMQLWQLKKQFIYTNSTKPANSEIGGNAGMAITKDGKHVLMCYGKNKNLIQVFNVESNTVIHNIVVGLNPKMIFIDNEETAYVTNFGSNSISVIDLSTFTVVNTITKEKNKTFILNPYFITGSDQKPIPTILELTPQPISIGETLTIKGNGFNSHALIDFPGAENTPAEDCPDSETLTVKVPEGAYTGNLNVSVAGTSSNSVKLEIKPTITSFNQEVTIGSSLTINGTGFGINNPSPTVIFQSENGDLPINGTWISSTKIVVTVPSEVVTGTIKVKINEISSDASTSLLTILPKVKSFSPQNFTIGSTIDVYGSGFSTEKGKLDVLFYPDGQENPISAPGEYSTILKCCTCTVPSGVQKGKIAVQSNGNTGPKYSTEYISLPTITSITPKKTKSGNLEEDPNGITDSSSASGITVTSPIYVFPGSPSLDSLIYIEGTNFNSEDNTVWFENGEKVHNVPAFKNGLGYVKVPEGGTGYVSVESFGAFSKSAQKIYACTGEWRESFNGLTPIPGKNNLFPSKNNLPNGMTMELLNKNGNPQVAALNLIPYSHTVGKWITIAEKYPSDYKLSFKMPDKNFFCIESLKTLNQSSEEKTITVDYFYQAYGVKNDREVFNTPANTSQIHQISTSKGAGLKELQISFEDTTDFSIFISQLMFVYG